MRSPNSLLLSLHSRTSQVSEASARGKAARGRKRPGHQRRKVVDGNDLERDRLFSDAYGGLEESGEMVVDWEDAVRVCNIAADVREHGEYAVGRRVNHTLCEEGRQPQLGVKIDGIDQNVVTEQLGEGAALCRVLSTPFRWLDSHTRANNGEVTGGPTQISR